MTFITPTLIYTGQAILALSIYLKFQQPARRFRSEMTREPVCEKKDEPIVLSIVKFIILMAVCHSAQAFKKRSRAPQLHPAECIKRNL